MGEYLYIKWNSLNAISTGATSMAPTRNAFCSCFRPQLMGPQVGVLIASSEQHRKVTVKLGTSRLWPGCGSIRLSLWSWRCPAWSGGLSSRFSVLGYSPCRVLASTESTITGTNHHTLNEKEGHDDFFKVEVLERGSPERCLARKAPDIDCPMLNVPKEHSG